MNILAQTEFWHIAGLLIGFLVLAIFVAIMLRLLGLYIRALISGAPVGFLDLIRMKIRRIDAQTIIFSRIQAMRAGLAVTQAEMESHVLAGGDVDRVIRAMIVANKTNIDLSWKTATAKDLAGRGIRTHNQKGAGQ